MFRVFQTLVLILGTTAALSGCRNGPCCRSRNDAPRRPLAAPNALGDPIPPRVTPLETIPQPGIPATPGGISGGPSGGNGFDPNVPLRSNYFEEVPPREVQSSPGAASPGTGPGPGILGDPVAPKESTAPKLLTPVPLPSVNLERGTPPAPKTETPPALKPERKDLPPEISDKPRDKAPLELPNFATVLERGPVTTSRRPELEGFDWLKTHGYKTVVYLHEPDAKNVDSAREVTEKLGLKFVAISVTPETLPAAYKSLARLIQDANAQPLHAFSTSDNRAGSLWYLVYRELEMLSDDAARVRAGKLGLGDPAKSEEAKQFWLAVQDFLSKRLPPGLVSLSHSSPTVLHSPESSMTRPGPGSPLVSSLVPSAVYTFPDIDALDAAYGSTPPGFVYARDGHPNATDLTRQLNALQGALWGAVTASGMGAITAAVLPRVRSGDRIVASDRLYGKTNKLFRELERFGVWTEFVNVCDLSALAASLNRERAAIVFLETISNPLCRVCDLPAVVALAHQAEATVIVDNTFASPVLFRPLEHGADIVMESLTKIISGHSDVTLGYIGGNDPAIGTPAVASVSTLGVQGNPFDCWLTLRSLETLDLRADFATDNALDVAEWLSSRPEVSRVVFPGLPNHPDHAVATRLLPRGFGHMLCLELPGGREAVNQFMRAAPGIPFAPSLGHTATTCSHPDTTSHRYETAEEKTRQGISPGLIRLSVGCEPLERITAELERGLLATH